MESPIQWTWIWANSGRYWRIGKPGVLQFMESQRVGQDLVTKQQHMIYTYTHICLHTHTHNGFLTLNDSILCVFSSGRNFLLEKKLGLSTLRALTDRASRAPSELPSWTTCTSLPLVWTKLPPVSVVVLILAHCVFRWISALVFSCFHITSDVQLLHLASFIIDAQIHRTGIAIWFFSHLLFKKYLFIFGSS